MIDYVHFYADREDGISHFCLTWFPLLAGNYSVSSIECNFHKLRYSSAGRNDCTPPSNTVFIWFTMHITFRACLKEPSLISSSDTKVYHLIWLDDWMTKPQCHDKVKPRLRQTDVVEQNLKAKEKFSICTDVFEKKADRDSEHSETCKIVWKMSYHQSKVLMQNIWHCSTWHPGL